VESMSEIVLGTSDVAAMRPRWQRLLDPARPTRAGAWQVGAGPAIRIVPAKRIASRHLSCDLNRARARKRSFTPMAPSRGSRDRLRPLIRASATERSTTARPPVVAQVERTGCPMCVYKFGRAEMGERVPDSCGPPDRIRRRPGHGRSPLFHQRVDKPPPAAPALDLAGPPRRGLHGDTGSGGQDVPSPQSPPPS
jgi:hypothetical protein